MNSAYKKLGTNIFMFAISSFGTKIIGFLLVPLYTNYLSTAEYGTADMLSTILSILVPVFSIDIADGVIRYVLDKRYEPSSVLHVAIKTISLGSIVLFILMICVRLTGMIDGSDFYYIYLFFSFVSTCFYNTFVNYLKGKERITVLVVAGLMCSLLNAGCNILFLTRLGWGVNGYLIASVLSTTIPTLYLIICAGHYRYLKFKGIRTDKELQKQMLIYSAPLILNGLAWWVNNSLDRFFVTFICGVSANGVLAVAYKIPSILSMLQTIFNQAWSLSAIQEFDPEDKNGFIGKVYSYYGCAMTISCSVILLFNVFLARILYANDFFVAWEYTGMLIIANLFGGMSVCISGVFNAVKDTKTLATTTAIGGVINTILNTLMIPLLSVQGAVISTMISNVVVWLWRMWKVRSYITLKICLVRDVISYVLVTIQCIAGLSESHLYVVQILIGICIVMLYRSELQHICYFVTTRLVKRKK